MVLLCVLLFLTQASPMLEFVNQAGRLVVRGEAIVLLLQQCRFSIYGFAHGELFFVPYPSKLHVGVCKPGWPSGCEGVG